jgi:hypothetical protein
MSKTYQLTEPTWSLEDSSSSLELSSLPSLSSLLQQPFVWADFEGFGGL